MCVLTRLGLEWIHSVNRCLLSTYCVSGHLIYRVSLHFTPTPAFVRGTNDHSHFTGKKTTGTWVRIMQTQWGKAPQAGEGACA